MVFSFPLIIDLTPEPPIMAVGGLLLNRRCLPLRLHQSRRVRSVREGKVSPSSLVFPVLQLSILRDEPCPSLFAKLVWCTCFGFGPCETFVPLIVPSPWLRPARQLSHRSPALSNRIAL